MEQSSLLKSVRGIDHGFYDCTDTPLVRNPVMVKQIHSARAIVVNSPDFKESADAMVTKIPGVNLAIQTGDCAPVLFVDPIHRVIGAAHAGWRGALTGIIESALLAMVRLGADVQEVIAAIGPCIHKENYRVSPDFSSQFSADVQKFFSTFPDGVHFDLPFYVAHRLKEAGVGKVDVLPTDTYSDERFYSFRRQPKEKGRQLSCICLSLQD